MFALKVSALLFVVAVVSASPWHDGKHDHCHYKDVVIYNYRQYFPKDECVKLECLPTEILKKTCCEDVNPGKTCSEPDMTGKYKVIFPNCCKCE